MYIVIQGGGKVGAELARTLTAKRHAVALIEKQSAVIAQLAEALPANVLLIKGDGCDVKRQEEAGAGRADVFVAVTGEDEDNFVACQLARIRFNVPRTLARVNNPPNESTFNALKIETISATTVISNLIEKEMTTGEVFTLHILKKGHLALVEIQLAEDHCVVANKQLLELELPQNTVFVTVIRGDQIIVPRGNTVLDIGDRVIAVTPIEQELELRRLLTGN